jgi:hypothetical protein
MTTIARPPSQKSRKFKVHIEDSATGKPLCGGGRRGLDADWEIEFCAPVNCLRCLKLMAKNAIKITERKEA